MRIFFSSLALVLGALPSFSQSTGALPPFENPPVLDAYTILRPEFVHGANFSVRREVPTSKGLNHYTIDSDFGVFTADGNSALVQRLSEIRAMAKLREISRSDNYAQALKEAAKSPLKLAEGVVKHPVDTAGNITKGVWKMINTAGQSVKEVGQGRKQSKYEDSSVEGAIGFSTAKRQLAFNLGVDPYSDNEVFQKALNDVAWASFAGHMTFSVALMPIGGTAGMAVKGVNAGGSSLAALRDLSPADLRLRNLKLLLAMGIDRSLANAFLNNPNLSPTNQTVITDSLNHLTGATGRIDFVELASRAPSGTAARRYQDGARLLALIQKGRPIAAISAYHSIPLARTVDGLTIAPLLEWDYAYWTSTGQNFINVLKTAHINGRPGASAAVYLTGAASPNARAATQALGVGLVEKALPGPLN